MVIVRTLVAIAIVASLGIPGRAADVQGVTPTSILIGVQVPLTGNASSVGQGFKAGAELAADEINAHGGINGRKVELVFEDDGGTAEGGISAVRRLMDLDKVFAIFSGGTSTSVASVIPLIRQSNFLYYDSVASDPRVLETYSPYVFSGTTVTRADMTSFLTRIMSRLLKAKNVATLTSDEALCTSTMRLISPKIAEAGMKLVSDQKYQSGDTDFTAQLNALKTANPDVIYMCGLPADGGRIIPQIRRAGISAKLLGDGTFADSVTIRAAGNAIEGFYSVYVNSTQFIEENRGAMAEWRARFSKRFPNPVPGNPNSFTLDGYGDFYVLAEGIRRAGRDVTSELVIAGLQQLQNFIAGKDRAWSYAVPVATPRSFKDGDHKGSREAILIVVHNGEFTRLNAGVR